MEPFPLALPGGAVVCGHHPICLGDGVHVLLQEWCMRLQDQELAARLALDAAPLWELPQALQALDAAQQQLQRAGGPLQLQQEVAQSLQQLQLSSRIMASSAGPEFRCVPLSLYCDPYLLRYAALFSQQLLKYVCVAIHVYCNPCVLQFMCTAIHVYYSPCVLCRQIHCTLLAYCAVLQFNCAGIQFLSY